VLESTGSGIPTWTPGENKTFASLHWVATRKDTAGRGSRIQLKLASRAGTAQPVRIQLAGVKTLSANGTLTVLSSADPQAGNSLDEPTRIAPKVQPFNRISRDFTLTLPAYSVAVLEFDAQ
jgi:alpha-N-arabinofuranosidase